MTRLREWAAGVAGDIRYGLRTWQREPGYVAVAVLSLAAGIGLNTAVFSVINTIFMQGLRGVPSAERVASVGGRMSYAAYREVRDGVTSVEGAGAWQPVQVDLRSGDLAARRVVPAVSNNYFAVLGVRPVAGRLFAPAASREPQGEPEVVLDYEFFREHFGGDPAAIGRTVVLSGVTATIVGVAPQTFHGFGPERPPMWIAMSMVPAIRGRAPAWSAPEESGWRVFARMRDGIAIAQLAAEVRLVAGRQPALFPSGAPDVSSGAERWTGPVSAEKRIEFLLVVVMPLAIVGLILWIGCSNVANLLLARASARRKEIAIRLAAGASRARLVRLLLTESLLLAAAGGALGVLLARWTLDFVWAMLRDLPPLAIELDARVWLYTSAVSLAATMLFGLAPALHATRVDVAPLLKGEDAASDRRRGMATRTFFLVTQFASSMAILVIAATLVRTAIATRVGAESALIDRLTVARVETTERQPAARQAFWSSLRGELGRGGGIAALTLTPESRERVTVPAAAADARGADRSAALQPVDAGYFQTLGIQFVAGRDLAEPPASASIVVNQTAAHRFWGSADVVGKRITFADGTPRDVVGVVRDDGADARVFTRMDDGAVGAGTMVIRTAGPAEAALPALRGVFARATTDRVFVQVGTYRDAALGGFDRLTRLAVAIALLVLTLATVGLYGSVSFTTAQRTREIAIRLAVGAPATAVVRLLGAHAVTVVGAGAALGLVAIGVAFSFMSGMIFARWTLDPLTIAGVLATLAAATLGASYAPGRRALRIEPVRALRE